jgi:WD40 repeat protein
LRTCLFGKRLPPLLAGELPQTEQLALMEHVETCRDCQQTLEELTAVPPRASHLIQAGHTATHLADVGAGSGPVLTCTGAVDEAAADWPTIPGYEIQRLLGRGGMGVVYQALHISLNRLVALKMIAAAELATPEQRARLQIEGEILARLQHPNIVQVFEVGTCKGQHFLAMELITGGNLAEALAGQPQVPRQAAGFVETLARAVHHAHQQGVIHRDLKPANVLLSFSRDLRARVEPALARSSQLNEVVPKISDFGLAKHRHNPLHLTRIGFVAGTPSYMAPEQAEGQPERTGPASDIYALGAILYEVLTARPPFQGASPMETLSWVLNREPAPIRRLRPETPRDLETICLKCLQKEPGQRYATALDLAEDLRRFLDGVPIHARPVGAAERFLKWVQRRPAVAVLLAAVLLVSATGLGLVFWQWSRAEARALAEAEARQRAQDREAAERRARQEVERLSSRSLLEQGQGLCDQGEIGAGLLSFARALEIAERAGDAPLERVARFNLAAWRPHFIRQRAEFRHTSWAWALAYSPDGRWIATGDKAGIAHIWDAATGKHVAGPLRHPHPVWDVVFSPDGKLLLTASGAPDGSRGEAHLWQVPSGTSFHGPLRHATPVNHVAFHPDGQRFLSVSPPQAQLWKTVSQEPIGQPLHPGATLTAALSPDGNTVLTGGADGTARLWKAASGEPVGQPMSHGGGRVEVVAFSPDSQTLATASNALVRVDPQSNLRSGPRSEVRLWQAATGTPHGGGIHAQGWVKALAFAPGSQVLATGTVGFAWTVGTKDLKVVSGEARLWRVSTGQPLSDPLLHPHAVWALAFSPNGRFLLTGCEDTTARLYRLTPQSRVWTIAQPLTAPLRHEGLVRAVAFSPDGRSALTASAGGDVATGAAARLWDIPPEEAFRRVVLSCPAAQMLTFSPDGAALLTVPFKGQDVQRFEMATARERAPAFHHDGQATALAFRKDGKVLATCGHDRCARLWDWPSGRRLCECRHSDTVLWATFPPDGRTLLTVTADGVLHAWEVATGRALEPPWQPGSSAAGMAFTDNGEAHWFRIEGENTTLWRKTPAGPVERSWQVPGRALHVSFRRDGRTCWLISRSHSVELRDLRTGERHGPALRLEPGPLSWLESPDARSVLISTARSSWLLDPLTGLRLGPSLEPGFVVGAFRPDGCQIAGMVPGANPSGDVPIKVWQLPAPVAGTAKEVRRAVEALTGDGSRSDTGVDSTGR